MTPALTGWFGWHGRTLTITLVLNQIAPCLFFSTPNSPNFHTLTLLAWHWWPRTAGSFTPSAPTIGKTSEVPLCKKPYCHCWAVCRVLPVRAKNLPTACGHGSRRYRSQRLSFLITKPTGICWPWQCSGDRKKNRRQVLRRRFFWTVTPLPIRFLSRHKPSLTPKTGRYTMHWPMRGRSWRAIGRGTPSWKRFENSNDGFMTLPLESVFHSWVRYCSAGVAQQTKFF